MPRPTESYKQFHYALRPSKQVERKIMIDVLLRLWQAGYDIRNYAYLGFGSVYYVDFIMFHKYLHIHDMTCIEWGDVPKRMKFNKPYKFVKLRIGALSDHVGNITTSKAHLVWLDYDRALDKEILLDIEGCLARMRAGSIFTITVDARPKLPPEYLEREDLSLDDRLRLTASTYREWFQEYIEEAISVPLVASSAVNTLFYDVIVSKIQRSLLRLQTGLGFFQLFHYVYRDGAPMLTVGGLLCRLDTIQGILESEISRHDFVVSGREPLEISVPPLTIKEKQWLDSRLDSNLSSSNLAFELEPDLLENYRRFYREYPTYAESLL